MNWKRIPAIWVITVKLAAIIELMSLSIWRQISCYLSRICDVGSGTKRIKWI